MALARLTKQCRECPFVETCEHKEMEALGYLPEPIMADVKAPVTADIAAPFSGIAQCFCTDFDLSIE